MRRARGEKGETNLSRRGETEHSRRDKERIGGTVGGGRRGGRSKREKGEAVRGATKVAVTLYKASKPNERGPKGKKTRRSALRGDAEGNGGGHEEEARRCLGGRRWQGCKVEVVVPRTASAFRANSDVSRKLAEKSLRLDQNIERTGNI